MAAILVLNTTSLRDHSASERHSQILDTLADTLIALRFALPTWSRDVKRLKVCLPKDVYSFGFSSAHGETRLGVVLNTLDKSKRDIIRKLFEKPDVTFDPDGSVNASDAETERWSAGLEAKWANATAALDPPLTAVLHLGSTSGAKIQVGSALLSASTTGWQTTPVRISVMQQNVKMAAQDVANFWIPKLQTEHKLWLVECELDVLPAYENPGQHEPDFLSNRQVPYDPKKSFIPIGAEKLLASARRLKDGRWWAYCECKAFHRFQGTPRSEWPLVHWNGTTHRNAKQITAISDVPTELQKLLKADPTVNDCGCRS